MEVSGQPTEVEFQGSDLECQTQCQVPPPTEPFHRPMDYHFASLVLLFRKGLDFRSLKWFGEVWGWGW